MIYLMRFGFNGIYRTNQRGQFNVPYAPRKTGRLPTREELGNAAAALRGAQLEHADFETVLDSCRRGDFVYMDPPYAGASHRSACQFGPGAFTVADIPRLIAALHGADRRGVKFVLSYASVPELQGALSGWQCDEVRVRRVVAGSVKARGEVRELLVSNFRAGLLGLPTS
jgi:DNA adenine methylase